MSNSNIMNGKKGVIMGVVNDHSIAWHIAKVLHQNGAKLAFSHLPDKGNKISISTKIKNLVEPLNPDLVMPCDVSKDEDIENFFNEIKKIWNNIDFLVHSIAFAKSDDIKNPTIQISREGFHLAIDISAYSFIAVCQRAYSLMQSGGSILCLTYFGGEKVIPGYNVMGVCKATLEAITKYLAYDLGPKNIRVNAISAGPIKTLASSVLGINKMLELYKNTSPLQRNIEGQEIAKSALYLLSDLSSAVTGEIHHVDCGYNIMGAHTHCVT